MAHLIPWSNRFVYEKLERIDTSAGREYLLPSGTHVPSVTTVLDRTKDKTALKEWADRVGQEEAIRQKEQAAYIGTWMHTTLEHILEGKPLALGHDWLAMKGHQMAFTLANRTRPATLLIAGGIGVTPIRSLLEDPALGADTERDTRLLLAASGA